MTTTSQPVSAHRTCSRCGGFLLPVSRQLYCHRCGAALTPPRRLLPGLSALRERWSRLRSPAAPGAVTLPGGDGGRRALAGTVAATLALLAVALAVHDHPYGWGRIWPFCLLAAAAMLVAPAAFRGLGDREQRPGPGLGVWFRPRSPEFLSGAGCLFLGLILLGWSLSGFLEPADEYRYQWLGWIAAATLALLGFYLMDRRVSATWRAARRGLLVRVRPGTLVQCALLLAVLTAAAAVRLPQLDTLPAGMYHDEVVNLERALSLGNTSQAVPPYDQFTTSPPAYTMMVWLASELVGVSIHTGRLVSAVMGVAGVGAMYLLGRRIMGAPLGILSAATLAFLAWDLNWSRIGMENIAAPLCAALAAWATLRALSTGRVSDFALAGAVSAAGVWFYEAYYLFAVVVGAMLLHGLVLGRPEARMRVVGGTIAMGLLALVWAAPVVGYALDETDDFLMRSRQVSIFHDRSLGDSLPEFQDNVGKHLRMYHFAGDRNGRHNLPGAPMLDHLSGALMLLGVALAAVRWRRTGLVLLPLWLAAMMMPGMMTLGYEAPQSLRSIHVLPAVALLIALPLALLWRSVTLRPGWWRVPARTLVVAAALLAAGLGVGQYFGAQADHPQVYAEFSTEATLTAWDVPRRLEDGYAIGASPTLRWNSTADLIGLWPRPTVLSAPGSVPIDPRVIGDRRGIAIYAHSDAAALADTLSRYYPEAEAEAAVSPGSDRVLFYRIIIGRDDLWKVAGLQRVSANDGSVTAARDTGSLHADGFGSVYRGSLHVRRDGEYQLLLAEGHGVRVTIGDLVLPDADGETLRTARLATGLHAMEIRVDEDANPAAALLWRGPDRRAFEPVAVPHLYHGSVSPAGMVGRYYIINGGDDANAMTPLEDTVAPDAMAAMPSVNRLSWKNGPPVPRPFLVVLDGVLNAPGTGLYEFMVDHCYGELAIVLNGKAVYHGGNGVQGVELEEGEQRLQLRYRTSRNENRCELYWRHPGQGNFTAIPVDAVRPP